MSVVQKYPEDVSAGIGKKKYKVLNKFSCNLRSKSARSTLTSTVQLGLNTSLLNTLETNNLVGNIRKKYDGFHLILEVIT